MATFLGSSASVASTPECPTPDYSFTSETTYLHVLYPSATRRVQKPQAYAPKKLTSPDLTRNTSAQQEAPTLRRSSKIQAMQPQYVLVDLLQNIQMELASHRSMMLDIQSRLAELEQKPRLYGEGRVQKPLTARKDERTPSRQLSKRESHIRQNWWKACQNFAKNSDTPVDIEEFLGRSRCFSGFDFDFDLRPSNSTTKETAPKLFDLPPLTPASEVDTDSGLATPEYHRVAFSHRSKSPRGSKAVEVVGSDCDIVEQIVEVNEVQRIVTPLLQSPPGSRKSASSRVSYDRDVTALPAIPHNLPVFQEQNNTHRRSKSMQRLLSCKAVFKKKQRSRSKSSLN